MGTAELTKTERAPVASLADVSHRYGDTTALDGLTLDIPAGVMAGVIGPDSVGKSTLLGIVSGIRRIQSGSVRVLDGDIAQAAHRRSCLPRIAYMPQGLGRNLYSTLSVFENIDFFGRLFGQGEMERKERIADLLDSTGLAPFPDRPAGKLSGGMKQKLSLCCALIHDPDLLVLDEPTTGVDPLSRRQFWDLIERMRQRRPNMSVIVATAYMEEAERFDWLVAMDSGRAIATGSPEETRAGTGMASLEEAFVSLLPEEKRRGHRSIAIPPRSTRDGPAAIEAKGLTKKFGNFVAVDHVSFKIEKGEIFGFLGSNGCGKTTTMKMLTGLLSAEEGKAWLLGSPVEAQDISTRKRVGYMSQSFSLYRELTIRQNLDLHAGIFSLPKRDRPARVAELLTQFGLEGSAGSLPDNLPLGVRQRLQLAVAILHRPEILILDEPTSGVDPVARDQFWQYLIELSRRDGITIFLSTHFMNEAERCDRISLMHAGKVLAVGAPQDIVRSRRAKTLEDAFIAYLQDAAAREEKKVPSGAAPTAGLRGEAAARAGVSPAFFDPRRLWAYARREAIEVFRDPIRMAFALLGPALLMVAFGFGITFDVENLPFAALDRDRTFESRELISNFEGSRYFRRLPDLADETDLDQRLKRGEMVLALDIPAGFGRDFRAERKPEVGVSIDGSMPFRGETVRSYVTALAPAALGSLAVATGDEKAAEVSFRMRYNQEFRSALAIVPGVVMLMLMLIPAMMTAAGVVREKELGSIANFHSTPVTQPEYLIGKQLPYWALSMASFLVLLGEAHFLFGVPVRGSLVALTAGAAAFTMASTGFGLLVSSFTRTQIAAIFATPILTMIPAIDFSGMLTPTASLPLATRIFGLVFPSSWFQPISVGTFTKGLGIADLWPNHLALAAFAAAFIGLSCLALRKQEA